MPLPNPRPNSSSPDPARQRKKRLQQLRTKLESQRLSWSRWMSRLKRAFHSVEKVGARIARLEREISKLTHP